MAPLVSIPPARLGSVIELLQQVEALPSGATGALSYGELGAILVQNKRICWAVAAQMPKRLTDILCTQKEPPLPRDEMERLFRRCKEHNRPIGEALVSGGLLSEEQLRSALRRHNGEAISLLAAGQPRAGKFVPHAKTGYDPRFVFTTADLLASQSGKRTLSGLAQEQLDDALGPDTNGFAFVRDEGSGGPVLLAVNASCELRVAEALEIGAWASRLFDVTTFFDPSTQVASATWCASTSLVTWRAVGVHFAVLCSSRPASTLLINQLARHAQGQEHLRLEGSHPKVTT
jgi:hypothetical protein